MTDDIIPKITQDNNCYILYDESALQKPSAELFNPAWLNSHGKTTVIGSGRGAAWFVDYDNQQWVLRHYRRGGFISRFIHDSYWNPLLNRSRSWREWKLLKTLYTNNLPTARPVAACVQRFLGFYKADIIVERIPDTETLASILIEQPLTNNEWHSIGFTIRQFHDLNIYHADLNANNILLNKNNDVFVIDFDRGKIKSNGSWKEANLQRLQRSLNKLKNTHKTFIYQDENWQALIDGYYNK